MQVATFRGGAIQNYTGPVINYVIEIRGVKNYVTQRRGGVPWCYARVPLGLGHEGTSLVNGGAQNCPHLYQ